MHSKSAKIENYLLERYPGTSEESAALRQSVLDICQRFKASGVADRDFESELCSGAESRFWQRFTEAALTCEVLDAGLKVLPCRSGPDLCIEIENQKIWIEFICPEPTGIPRGWLTHEPSRCLDVPHEPVLLRWTSAIKEKSEKLMGIKGKDGYIAKGIVNAKDSYVIAVNGRQLRGAFPTLNGISQFPYAAEAVFPFGPYQFRIDRETLAVIQEGHQHRPYVKKSASASVPTCIFLEERFAAVSAIWATDIDEYSVFRNKKDLAVVHNPLAINQLPLKLLPAWSEYVATAVQDDMYRIDHHDGRLKL